MAASTLPSAQRFSQTCLKAAVGFWFVVTIAGQLLFAFTVASFYGLTAARGQVSSWNRVMLHGYVAGDTEGNLVVALHLASAVIIILSGAIQIAPLSRNRAPAFHRWNGRLYMVSAFNLGEAYMNGGDTIRAVANYQESLRLNPKNSNAVKMLRKLNGPTS